MEIVYLSGPMTGKEKLNFPLFSKVARMLEIWGWDVINPCETAVLQGWATAEGEDLGTYNENISMGLEIEAISKASLVILLPGWATSKGSMREAAYARLANKPILDLEDLALAIEMELNA